MTFTVNSYAVKHQKSSLKPYRLVRRDLHADDVLIRIMYCGVCHSDIHIAHEDWGPSHFPFVPGHEIVGVVEKVGNKVSNHRIGDMVAVGCMVDSCGTCSMCEQSKENYCTKLIPTYGAPDPRAPNKGDFTAGGYSEKIVVKNSYVCSVPKALQTPELLPGVAPILCAGVTTYEPMVRFGLKKHHKVAVVGLGGLGGIAVKIANSIGAEVTVISRSHKKDSQAKALGASDVLASTSKQELKANAFKFDLILDTIPFDHNVNIYIPLLKPEGTLTVLGHIGKFSTPINSAPLLFYGRTLAGSMIGGIRITQDLLELCAEHKIIAEHKLINMEDVNEAWKSMTDGISDQRFVIDVGEFSKNSSLSVNETGSEPCILGKL